MVAEAQAPKLEISTRDALLALGFVFLVVLSVALAQVGIITNPLTLGLMVTLAIGLLFVGYFLVRAGIINRSALPMWYVFTFGVVLLVYGAIEAGYIPVAFLISEVGVTELALTNAMFYTLLIMSVIAAAAVIYAGYRYYKKRALEVI